MITTNNTITIKEYATYLSIPANVGTGAIGLDPYINMFSFLRTHLTEYDWDHKLKRNIVIHQFYDISVDGTEFLIPSHLKMQFSAFCEDYLYNVKVNVISPPKPMKVKFGLNESMALRDDQIVPVRFMSSPKYPISAVELGCGTGKTFMSISAIIALGHRALIIVPPFVMALWIENLNKLLLDPSIVLILQGHAAVKSLVTDPKMYGDAGPKIVLASSKTLSRYAMNLDNYKDFIPFHEFIELMRFGTKVYDEVHVNFHQNTMVDLHCNVQKNIYLSATYDRSSKSSKRIFGKVFPSNIRYSEEDKIKHVNITEYEYYTGGPVKSYHTNTNRGYSQYKYEKWLLMYEHRRNITFNNILLPVIHKYYYSIKCEGQKLLIIVGLKSFAAWLHEEMKRLYKDLTCNTFLSGTSEEVLSSSDVIISTVGSMGTGKDVSNLRSMIVFVSMGSAPQNEQLLGRLRKMPSGDSPEFVYMVNTGIESHLRHAEFRRKIFEPKSLSFKKIVA